VAYVDTYGALYPNGAVQIYANGLGITDFLSWGQFMDYVSAMGEYRVVWMALPPSAGEVLS
jgi:hypothetical protein